MEETKKVVNINDILEVSGEMGVTDIHITAGSPPCVRQNKKLKTLDQFGKLMPEDTSVLLRQCLTEEKIIQLENEGEVDYAFSRPGIGRYRVNAFRQRGTYAMAIRSQPFEIPQFDTLNLPESVRKFSERSKGLVLVTGTTGSGKSTTLASLIDIINSEQQKHIITIEDPIEYLHKHKKSIVNQREIGLDSGNFSHALRATLREDPDVILVGEMRDLETISIALTAAETGHLVFSTLHTMGAAKTVDRILDVFPSSQQNQVRSQLATVLEGVVSQQLIPKRDSIGVTAACEVMVVNSAVRNLIREGKPFQINSVIQTGASLGMQSMDSSLAKLVMTGEISREEAISRAQNSQTLFQLMNKRW